MTPGTILLDLLRPSPQFEPIRPRGLWPNPTYNVLKLTMAAEVFVAQAETLFGATRLNGFDAERGGSEPFGEVRCIGVWTRLRKYDPRNNSDPMSRQFFAFASFLLLGVILSKLRYSSSAGLYLLEVHLMFLYF